MHLLQVLLVVVTSPVIAQSVIYTFDGDSPRDEFGVSVSGAGDVNGDGFADVIVGARYDDDAGVDAGSARVFSGRDGTILHTFFGNAPSDWFGVRVSGAGDVDGDGFDDLIVGAPGDDTNGVESGSAHVFSGRTGSVLFTFRGDSARDCLGPVGGAGDVNGDGYADLIVGAGADDNNGNASGSARVYSGRDGALLYHFDGDSPGDNFGFSVAGAGDVDRDGFDDVVVGAVNDSNTAQYSGSARVISGRSGTILYTFDGDSAGDRLGWCVSGAGDVNGDGFDDVIAGAPSDANNGTRSGSARVFSGRDGSILFTFDGDSAWDRFGWSVSGGGDVDGDGYADVIAGAVLDDNNGSRSGSARAFSGRTGAILQTFDGDSAGDEFGYAVGDAGDVNCDGFADLIVGARRDDNNGSESGSARVISGFTSGNPTPPLFKPFGHGCAGSNGWLPHIGSRGRPVVGQTFTLTLRAARAGTAAVIHLDLVPRAIDLGLLGAPGCRLWTLALAARTLTTDRSGRASLPLGVPNATALLGVTLYAQWLAFDQNANALGWVASDGAMFRIGTP